MDAAERWPFWRRSARPTRKCARRRACPLGFAAPHMTRVYFKGGTGGEAVFADGHAVKLGVLKGFAFYDIKHAARRQGHPLHR